MATRRPFALVFLSLLFSLPFSLAAPATLWALPLNLNGCILNFGVTCNLGAVQFYVNEVNGGVSDPRVGQAFAKVNVSVGAFFPSHPSNTGGFDEFLYTYQIFDQQFAITDFLLDLSLTPPPAILAAGSIPDANPNTIAPNFAAYSVVDLAFAAVFLGPPITPAVGVEGSDVLFIRSTANPADITGNLAGFDNWTDALVGWATLKGPGSEITASSHAPAVPEPATVILLAGGLFALAAGLRPRRKETPPRGDRKMTRQTKAFATFVVVLLAVVIPLRSHATPLLEINNMMIGSVAEVDIRIFGSEVSLLSQADRLAQDPRFAQVTPLTNELTYFYNITNVDGGTFANLSRLTMFKPTAAPVSSAGIISNGSVTAASVFPTAILFNFAPLGGLSYSDSLDLFLTSTYLPNTDLPNGVLLFRSPGGPVSGSLVGPDDEHEVPSAVPEPGTLLLLGSGFLGFALLSRNKFIRHRMGDRS